MDNDIVKFSGEYRFLSNFFSVPVPFDGMTFPSVEHAYQAAKAKYREDRIRIKNTPTPGQAKRLGRNVPHRDDWFQNDQKRIQVMLYVVRAKFLHNPHLADQLLATGDAELIEGNEWRDEFWGVYNGSGQNHLGKILMQVRSELRSNARRGA